MNLVRPEKPLDWLFPDLVIAYVHTEDWRAFGSQVLFKRFEEIEQVSGIVVGLVEIDANDKFTGRSWYGTPEFWDKDIHLLRRGYNYHIFKERMASL